jgi:hypothetical protein
MRINFANISRPKSVAKNMKVALYSFVGDVPLGRCQHYTASLYGYSNWHELQKSIGSEAPSLDDSVIDSQLAEARRVYQVERLVAEGLDQALTVYLIETLHPTRASFDINLSQAGLMEHMANLAGALGARRISLFCYDEATAEIAFYDVERGKLGKDVIRRPALARAVKAKFGVDHRTTPDYRSKFVIRTGSVDHVWTTMWTDDVPSRRSDGALVYQPVALFSAVRNPLTKPGDTDGGSGHIEPHLTDRDVTQHMALVGTRSWYGR